MTADVAGCPLCRAAPSMLEHLAHGWQFCNCCGRAFLVSEDRLLHQTEETNHTPRVPVVAVASTATH